MGASLPSGNRRGRGRRTPMAEINVTPLVDVMLVLLIIFMVTAPLLVAGVPIDLPESRASALDQNNQPINIAMDGAGAITIDDAPVAESELPQKLADIVERWIRQDPGQWMWFHKRWQISGKARSVRNA